MNYLALIGLVSAICSVLSFLITVFSRYSWGTRILWFVVVFILTYVSGLVVHHNSELERINDIHRQATVIYNDYSTLNSNKEFIQESLSFLEENKDRYPDSYTRALQIYSDMKNSVIQYDYEPAIEIRGIVKGIATINGE